MNSEVTDHRLRELLHHELMQRTTDIDHAPMHRIHLRVTQRRRTRHAWTAVAACAALLAGIVIGARVLGENDTRVIAKPSSLGDEVRTADVNMPIPASTFVRDPSGIEQLPSPPLDVRGNIAMAVGAEVILWGGTYEPAALNGSGPDTENNNGAVFNLTTRTWRPIGPAPITALAERPVAVATEDGAIIIDGTQTARLISATDTWERLDDAPTAVTDLHLAGDVALSQSANASLDLRTGTWHPLPAPPMHLERAASVWTGDDFIVIGGPGTPFTTAAAIAYRPTEHRWRILPEPPPELRAEALDGTWDGERAVFVNYDMHVAAYDPVSATWDTLASVPASTGEWVPTVVTTGESTTAFMSNAIAVLNAKDMWIPVPYGEIPLGNVAVASPDHHGRPASTTKKDTSTRPVFVLSVDEERIELFALDPDRLANVSGPLQLGSTSVVVPDQYTLTGTTFQEDLNGLSNTVTALLHNADHSAACKLRATYVSPVPPPLAELSVEEILPNTGTTQRWNRDPAGGSWHTEVGSSNTFDVSCDDAPTSRTIVESATFG